VGGIERRGRRRKKGWDGREGGGVKGVVGLTSEKGGGRQNLPSRHLGLVK